MAQPALPARADVPQQFTWDTTKPNGQPRRRLDVTRARERFGFEARTSFADGIKRTVAYYEENRARIDAAPSTV